MKTMPNLVGMSIGNAYSVLDTAGFGVPIIEYVSSNMDRDTVVSQSVEKNTMADVNSQIYLQVSQGPNGGVSDAPVTKSVILDLTVEFIGVRYKMEIYNRTDLNKERPLFSGWVEADQEQLTVLLTGTGKQYFDIYINGTLSWTEEVDFTI